MNSKVTLIPMKEDDLLFLLEIRNHESTRSQLDNDSKFSLEECQSWFSNLSSPWYIIHNHQNIPVGYFRTNGDVIGADIHTKFRRNGYAKSAFEVYLHDKDFASLEVFEDNFAIELYKKIGFKLTGRKKIVRGRNYVEMEYKK
ncbi:GNAT family N-acetyltransferase [Gammaproteobacteria bacterium]|nr:GNAT family N-acetyltransferase [Gammaproteobacteria bacterium]MDC0090020.1 GNAT family N-acetyltransferase [Gammaproteobacteria bacterium]